jgi:hypothetical protein
VNRSLETPGNTDTLCGISTLTAGDLAASKLLANSDRYADEGVFCRDLIDLAMLAMSLPALRQAISKAETAYGSAVRRDLARAIDQIEIRPEKLKRCMQAMAMEMEQAQLWQKIRNLKPLCQESG